MRVVLLNDVKNLGNRGEIKEVANGFALNFLLPRKLAAAASPQIMLKLEAEALAARQAAEDDLRRTELLASKLDGLEVDMIGKSHPGGTLYAAITPAMIAAYLTKQGYNIDKSQIVLIGLIKEIGDHKATIKFRHGLEAEVLIHVKGLEPGGIVG